VFFFFKEIEGEVGNAMELVVLDPFLEILRIICLDCLLHLLSFELVEAVISLLLFGIHHFLDISELLVCIEVVTE